MAEKKKEFALMNILIKGTPASIQSALAKLDSTSYELVKFNYNPEKVDSNDATIVKVGLVFNEWWEDFIAPDEIPFVDMPDIKFIGLGNGGDGNRCNGSFVFYKDFSETSVSEYYKFSETNPQMEEFDGQEDVCDAVCRSFMDRAWRFVYLDYSDGENHRWSFGKKKDKELIAKWENDKV